MVNSWLKGASTGCKRRGYADKNIGPVQLKQGIHTLVIQPVSITKQELMRPLELLLIKK